MAKVCMLDILREADASHPFTQDKIRRLLESRYGIVLDRKTVHRQLNELAESVDALHCREERRVIKGEETAAKTDFYLESEFDEEELQVLLYTTLFSRHLPLRFKRSLLKKLRSFASSDRQRRLAYCAQPDDELQDETNAVFWNLETANQAIAENHKLSFRYARYGTDKKLHESQTLYTTSPLGIAFRNDCFYLISLLDNIDDEDAGRFLHHIRNLVSAAERSQSHFDVFRLDRIRCIRITDEPRVDLSSLRTRQMPCIRNGVFDVQEYVRQNPLLEPGHAVSARLRLTESPQCSLTDVVDHIGKGSIRSITEKGRDGEGRRIMEIQIGAINNNVIRGLVLKSTPDIEVIEPPELRESICKAYEEALRNTGFQLAR